MAGNTDRRKSVRLDMECPWVMRDEQGATLGKGHALNVGNGGMFVPMALDDLPQRDATVTITFAVPRSTPNTYMLEDFSATGKVLRHQPLVDADLAGVAVEFVKPLELGLED